MIEMDFVTRFTVEMAESTTRGGASFAGRINHIILMALANDGLTIKRNDGGATELYCSTDVHRIEDVGDESGWPEKT